MTYSAFQANEVHGFVSPPSAGKQNRTSTDKRYIAIWIKHLQRFFESVAKQHFQKISGLGVEHPALYDCYRK
jgi:hypothetical protein